jgi:hypothetical protein
MKLLLSRENPVVPKYSTIKTDYGLQTEYVSDVSNYPHGLQHLAPEGFYGNVCLMFIHHFRPY